jgi:hypothetical protein
MNVTWELADQENVFPFNLECFRVALVVHEKNVEQFDVEIVGSSVTLQRDRPSGIVLSLEAPPFSLEQEVQTTSACDRVAPSHRKKADRFTSFIVFQAQRKC